MQFLDTLRAKIDIYKLEQRYTRRDKRTTFASGAQYIDGEYIYANSTGSSDNSSRNTGYQSRPPLQTTKSSTSFGSAGTATSNGIKNLSKRASKMFS